MSEESSNFQKQINRREMLKKGALATGAAVTAAAFLDGKWLKSVVKTGILPVHAQASMCVEYTFVPTFDWTSVGTVFELGVAVFLNPPNGPISYEVMDHNFTTFIPSGINLEGDLFGGTADFDGSYTVVADENSWIKIKWTYGGCDYPRTYTAEDMAQEV